MKSNTSSRGKKLINSTPAFDCQGYFMPRGETRDSIQPSNAVHAVKPQALSANLQSRLFTDLTRSNDGIVNIWCSGLNVDFG